MISLKFHLHQDLIEVKLNKEEENTEANLARGRRSRPIRTSGSEPKKKVVRKEDEDLDFEPESEHESESEDDRGGLNYRVFKKKVSPSVYSITAVCCIQQYKVFMSGRTLI